MHLRRRLVRSRTRLAPNLRLTPEWIYTHVYGTRGDIENRLEELKHALASRNAARNTTLSTNDVVEVDDCFTSRYPSITSPMPHGIPFTSPDVKR